MNGVEPIHRIVITEALHFILGESLFTTKTNPENTLPLQHVLEMARRHAAEVESNSVEVSHLWMALLRDEHNWLSPLLKRYGITQDVILRQGIPPQRMQ